MEATEHINTIRMKLTQLESALESGTVYSYAITVTAVHDICKAALACVPDICDITPDFFAELKKVLPEKTYKARKLDEVQNYLHEAGEQQ